MGKKWWRRRSHAGKGERERDPMVAGRQRDPQVLEGPMTEYISIVLKKLGNDDDDDANLKFVVAGTMTFEAFTLKVRELLNLAAEGPLQLFVGPRSARPDADVLMSSFPKHDYLYVAYE